MSNKVTTEAIFIPIDLEASLGRIEDIAADDNEDMECEPITRTSNNPFSEDNYVKSDHHIISPYPYSETDAEIKERKRLEDSVGGDWSLTGGVPPSTQFEWVGAGFELVPDDCDVDFSVSSEEACSLDEEDLELDKMTEDPASFWESGVPASAEQPSVIPFTVSFSSTGHESSSWQAPSIERSGSF